MPIRQATETEISSLKSEARRLEEQINVQADVTAAMAKEREALRSVVSNVDLTMPRKHATGRGAFSRQQ